MALGIGVVLAIVVGRFATTVGLDRDRAFYAVVLIVVASYYALFAVMGASTEVLGLELLAGAIFVIAAAWGFRTSLWIVAVGLAAHGLLDGIHGALITNPGVPSWWPAFCLGYDVSAAGFLAWLLWRGRVRVQRDS